MKAPQRMKLTKQGFETYTGFLGPVRFTDGVSDELVTFHLANRIAASMSAVYVDDDGNEAPAGAQVALMENILTRASEVEAMARQTEEERTREERARIIAAEQAPVDKFYSSEELEAIADADGIKGLRVVAEPWNVKGRSIPALIQDILDSQVAFVKDRDARRAAVGLKTEAEVLAELGVVERQQKTLADEAAANEAAAAPKRTLRTLAEEMEEAAKVTTATLVTELAKDASETAQNAEIGITPAQVAAATTPSLEGTVFAEITSGAIVPAVTTIEGESIDATFSAPNGEIDASEASGSDTPAPQASELETNADAPEAE